MFCTFRFYVGKWESYGISTLSYLFLVFMSALVNIVYSTTDQGCGLINRQSMPWVLFMCWCMPPLLSYIFCYFQYFTLVTWYRLSVGSSCMSLWFYWGESPSGSFLRSMGKLGLMMMMMMMYKCYWCFIKMLIIDQLHCVTDRYPISISRDGTKNLYHLTITHLLS